MDCKATQPVHPKGNQSWIFIGRTDAEAETLILWPPDSKNWLIWTFTNARKDWRWEEKGTTEDEMVECHHQLNGHEFEKTPGVGDGQGGLVCCSPWGCKESDMTEQLNWTELNWMFIWIAKWTSSLAALKMNQETGRLSLCLWLKENILPFSQPLKV